MSFKHSTALHSTTEDEQPPGHLMPNYRQHLVHHRIVLADLALLADI